MINKKQNFSRYNTRYQYFKIKKIKTILFIALVSILILLIPEFYKFELISTVQNTPLYRLGDESIGDLIESNFENEKWSVTSVSRSRSFVAIEGFMISLDEDIRIELSFDEDSESKYLHIQYIAFLDSDKVYTLSNNHAEILDFVLLLNQQSVEVGKHEISIISDKINT